MDHPHYPQPFLERVRIRNYKSIGQCDLALRPLTILVGRNGAGKSNFLDALQFVTDALLGSLDSAIKGRGGIDDVRRRSTGHPRNFAIELEVVLTAAERARYGFEIAAGPEFGFAVKDEWLQVQQGGASAVFVRRGSEIVRSSLSNMPPVSDNRLYLVNAAGLPEFRGVYDALAAMGFYSFSPEAMRELQKPDAGELLQSDGSNIASVLERLTADQTSVKERIRAYLSRIVPGIVDLERIALGPSETLLFRQEVEGSKHPWKFYAASMSDGTLRTLGALVAVTQLASRKHPVPLVGIEEPETALHPAAAGALVAALREVTDHTQILLTSHSADLLDEVSLEEDGLLVVAADGGTTRIAPIDGASREALKSHLYTAGELLRLDQLHPDAEDLRRQEQLRFSFSESE